MKKKVLAIVLCLAVVTALVFGLVACNNDEEAKELELPAFEGIVNPDYSKVEIKNDFKIGIICLHDDSSTYDKNFIDAANKAIAELGLTKANVIFKTNIPEDSKCKTAAEELVAAGCDVIFADSFGHEKFLLEVAKANLNIQFCHATGVSAEASKLANFHNAFASIYEGRYLAGVAAGLKLNEMIANGTITAEQAKMGYVGAFTYAEVISGYTSFYLGAKSVCPSVTMDVKFTGSWYDLTAEKETAEALIEGGCKLISQHADSMGAPSACERAGVPNVSYNGSTFEACPETFIVSSRIDWAPYFKYIITQTAQGKAIDTNWTGTLTTGSVVLTNVGSKAAAEGTVDKIVEVRKKLANGEINVFDTNNFTVNGAKVTSFKADLDGDFVGETEVCYDGIIKESFLRSAPYFDLRIDGIKLLNEKLG